MAEKQFYVLLIVSIAGLVAIAGLLSWNGGMSGPSFGSADCNTVLDQAAYFDEEKGECRPMSAMYPHVQRGNPATDHCIQSGGVAMVKYHDTGEEYGVCAFPNGTECEQWDLYNGQCPASD